jgi:ubiquinone/menaquinone biosynthesis C-methylase UbiE
MEIPGYLNFKDDESAFYGLDPLEESKFFGFLIKGCAEFIPLPDNFFSTIIFATSLDHLCSLKDTIKEIRRILIPGGVVIIWSSDVGNPILWKIRTFYGRLFTTFKTGTNAFRYLLANDNSVYLIPPGAVDPFHKTILTPKKIIKSFQLKGFESHNCTRNLNSDTFLTLRNTK